jgi:hypothetical protein
VTGAMLVGTSRQAFVADLAANTLLDLGTLGTAVLTARIGDDINVHGAAVGAAAVTGDLHAFLFDGTTLIDLNSAIPSGTGWVLREARGISDKGCITGSGALNGQPYRGFVVKPSAQGNLGQAIVAAVVQILAGIVGDGPGIELTLGGRVIHVSPHNPDPIIRGVSRGLNEALSALSITEIGSLVGREPVNVELRRQSLIKVAQIIEGQLTESGVRS